MIESRDVACPRKARDQRIMVRRAGPKKEETNLGPTGAESETEEVSRREQAGEEFGGLSWT